jgi:hypothetical protein
MELVYAVKCKVEGCNFKVKEDGLCDKHLSRFKKYGDADADPNNAKRVKKLNHVAINTCNALGCEAQKYVAGLCIAHYEAWGIDKRISPPKMK